MEYVTAKQVKKILDFDNKVSDDVYEKLLEIIDRITPRL